MARLKTTRTDVAVAVAVVVVLAMALLKGLLSDEPARRAAAPAPVAQAARQQPARPRTNPIEAMLRTEGERTAEPGVAVALLVDTSGSMARPARSGGGARAKIDAARESAAMVVERIDCYALEHPEGAVRLGVWEFSDRRSSDMVRTVVPLGAPDASAARRALARMEAEGGTPIGEALITAKRALDESGVRSLHVIVVTDGENTISYQPADVVNAMSLLPVEWRASVYFVAFDVNQRVFDPVRLAGALVFQADDESGLKGTLDYILTGKILVEKAE